MLPFTQEAFNHALITRQFRLDNGFFPAMQAMAIQQLFPDGLKAFVRDENDMFIIKNPRVISHVEFGTEKFYIEFETDKPDVCGDVFIFNSQFVNFSMSVVLRHPGDANPHIPQLRLSLTDFYRNKVKAVLLELEDVYNTFLIDYVSADKIPYRSPKVIGNIYYQRNSFAPGEGILNSFKGPGCRYLAETQPFIHNGQLVDCIVHYCTDNLGGVMYMASSNLLTAMELEEDFDSIRNKPQMRQPSNPVDEKSEKFFELCLAMVRDIVKPKNPHAMGPDDKHSSM
jgi:hypothetical protein